MNTETDAAQKSLASVLDAIEEPDSGKKEADVNAGHAPKQKELSVLLDRIAERADKATEGPWVVERIGDGLYVGNKSSQSCGLWNIVHRSDMTDLRPDAARQGTANAELIAAARTDLPRLVKALRKCWQEYCEMSVHPAIIAEGERQLAAILNGEAAKEEDLGKP